MAEQPTGTHRCAAIDCLTKIPLRHLMCKGHWNLVPTKIRKQLYRAERTQPRNWNSFAASLRRARRAVKEASIRA
ncbi:hypothetical protein DQ384_26190 [Sphaerisporangium album]|uniref:Uncharacterized protein n=1 Tax=Sphaerisporangium album TaxID=509200 RepID=A0A367FBG7_9ACTN|nr:hypothetical protein [Sphaerisporangium album]RCG27212.1 hypothetical protein DQ384_26190 [Sphaerisporangium album]